MKIKRVIIVVKKTALQRLKGRGDARLEEAMSGLELTNRMHVEALEITRSVTKAFGLEVEVVQRGDLPKLACRDFDCDLIITVGGDGTVLRTSHCVTDTPILGLNSNPHHSVGVLCGATAETLPTVLKKIIEGRIEPTPIQRLEASIDGKVTAPPALNELLFAHKSPASTSRYELRFKKHRQTQKSSGIWIATAAGSTAAAFAAGGKPLPIKSKTAQFVVRELYMPAGRDGLKSGTFAPGEKVEIVNSTMDAAVFVDGESVGYPVPFGHTVVVRHSRHPLRLVGHNIARRNSIVG